MLDAGLWPEQKTKDSLHQKRRFRYDGKVLVDLVGKSISFHKLRWEYSLEDWRWLEVDDEVDDEADDEVSLLWWETS